DRQAAGKRRMIQPGSVTTHAVGSFGEVRPSCDHCGIGCLRGSGDRRDGKPYIDDDLPDHTSKPIRERYCWSHPCQVQALQGDTKRTAQLLNKIATINRKLDIIPSIARNRVCPSSTSMACVSCKAPVNE